MTNVSKIINLAFREITEKGFFDEKKGNEPIPKAINKSMSDVPDIMTEYVNNCGYGCCFVFSAYMLKILEEYGVNAYMVTSIEGTGLRASVLYEDNGEMYIANPVEDIEYFTENGVKPEERHNYYIGDTCTMVIDGIEHNDSRYTIEDFSKKYGQLWVLGKMGKESDLTLSESMSKRKDNCIAPPEEANISVNTLIRKKG